ncbi:MAG: hypothetical protein ACMXX8_02370 [Candidatus Woesearchaeota archaeon]
MKIFFLVGFIFILFLFFGCTETENIKDEVKFCESEECFLENFSNCSKLEFNTNKGIYLGRDVTISNYKPFTIIVDGLYDNTCKVFYDSNIIFYSQSHYLNMTCNFPMSLLEEIDKDIEKMYYALETNSSIYCDGNLSEDLAKNKIARDIFIFN